MSRQSKKINNPHDPSFAVLAKEIANAIARNKIETNNSTQAEQIAELIESERLFHETVRGRKRVSTEIYKKFIQLIRVTNKNILSARPYFRESAVTFSAEITPALKANDPEALKRFRINYHFVLFVKSKWVGLWTEDLDSLYKRIERARTILIENNMPLAINRSKIFQGKIPKGGHLTLMDMIEISSMGLAAGIDKFTPGYKKADGTTPEGKEGSVIGVVVGRIVGNLIDAATETSQHFYPNDRRVLYRANSIRSRQKITDIPELTKMVNESFALDLKDGKTAPKPVTVAQLADLLAASSPVSADSNLGEDGYGVYSFTPDSSENAEELIDKNQQISKMERLASNLPIMHKKILRLKGISI